MIPCLISTFLQNMVILQQDHVELIVYNAGKYMSLFFRRLKALWILVGLSLWLCVLRKCCDETSQSCPTGSFMGFSKLYFITRKLEVNSEP